MFGYIVLAILICAAAILLPYVVTKMTESERKDSQFRDLFWREAGWRGRRIVCSLGCFWPLSIISGLPPNAKSILIMALIIGYCFYEHLKLYRGVKIFDQKMIEILSALVAANIVIQLLNRFEVIGMFALVFISGLFSLFWGWLVNYKRSKQLIRSQPVPEGEVA